MESIPSKMLTYSKQITEKSILVIYTGGTVGMEMKDDGSYAPSKEYLTRKLCSMYQFQAPNSPPRTFPVTKSGIRGHYDIIEYEPLLDSVNVTIDQWNQIGQDIYENYHKYDGFVVLHGTDTMAYSASAVSFMLEHLSKPVVFTGSQIPMSQTRSDATENVLGAFLVATELSIPEVCIFFNGKLYRGNRTSKVHASGLNAFKSRNLSYLAELSIDLHVNWNNIRTAPLYNEKLILRKFTCKDVACCHLFPGMQDPILKAFLSHVKGFVLMTYGSGNAPDARPEFLDILREAHNRGVVIVNVTQCGKGEVVQKYEAGVAIAKTGVISGGDMTVEAALTKLSYLLSDPKLSVDDVRAYVRQDLRGEISIRNPQGFNISHSDFIKSVCTVLYQNPSDQQYKEVKSLISPVLLCSLVKLGNLKELATLITKSNVNLNVGNYDQRYPIHIASAEGIPQIVEFLLQHGALPNVIDRWGNTPLDEAYKNRMKMKKRKLTNEIAKFQMIVDLLRENGGKLGSELL